MTDILLPRPCGKSQISAPQKHIEFRICILEDSQIDMLSDKVNSLLFNHRNIKRINLC